METDNIGDITASGRVNGKGEYRFRECIKVTFKDDTGSYRSLITTDSKLNLCMQKLENGNTLQIEVCSPDHDSLVFRLELTERAFKNEQYFTQQELTFDFKEVYQVISDFVPTMAASKGPFIQCTIRKSSTGKDVCELGLVSAAMTAKPSFRIKLEVLSGSKLIEYLEKINDSTKKKFNTLLEKYRHLKNIKAEHENMQKQIDNFKQMEQKHWAEKTNHQKQELALMGMAKENEEIKVQLEQENREVRRLEQQLNESEQHCEMYAKKLKQKEAELYKANNLIRDITKAHLQTKQERDHLREQSIRYAEKIKQLQPNKNMTSSSLSKKQTVPLSERNV